MYQLYAVKLNLLFGKLFFIFEDFSQLSSANEWHHKVESYLCCKEVENLGKKSVILVRKDLKLHEG